MSIQLRRGLKQDFDPNKLLPGELSTPLDTKELYAAFAPGDVQKIATYQNVQGMIVDATQEVVEDFTEQVNDATDFANTQGTYAKNQGDYAKTQGDYANMKGQEAQTIVDSAAPIINQNLQASYADKATITGTYASFPAADNALIELNPIGKTIETLANPSLEKSPDNPATFLDYNQGGNSKARSCGKNLIPKATSTQTLNGVTFTPQTDGSVVLNGTATGNGDYRVAIGSSTAPYNKSFIQLKAGVTYICSKSYGSVINNVTLVVSHKNAVGGDVYNNDMSSFTAQIDQIVSSVFIRVVNGITYNNVTVYPQLEIGSVPSPYQQHEQDEITILFSGRDLPNGVADTPELTKVGRHTVTANDVIGLDTTSSTTVDFVYISYNNMIGILIPASTDNIGRSMRTTMSIPRDNILAPNKHWLNPTRIMVSFDKGKYATFADAKVAFTGMIIDYELATYIPRTPTKQYLKSFKGITNAFNLDPVQTTFTWVAKSELWARDYLQDVAIVGKLDTSKIANNDLTTVEGYAWDARRGKAIRDDLNALSASKLSIGNDYRPNLLINGDFQVWQRVPPFNQSAVFCADRWRTQFDVYDGASATSDTDGIKLVGKNGTNICGIYQMIENGVKLIGKTVNMSTSINGVIYDHTFGVPNSNTVSFNPIQNIELRIRHYGGGDNRVYVMVSCIGNATTNIINWVKLEINDHATPFIPRLYAEELALCQRYYCKVLATVPNQLIASNTLISGSIFPVEMRTVPTVSIYSNASSYTALGVVGKVTDGSSGADVGVGAYADFKHVNGFTWVKFTTPPAQNNIGYVYAYTADAEIN